MHATPPRVERPRSDWTTTAPLIVYFSSISGNTHKFVEKIRARRLRLPLRTGEDTLILDEPFVLIVPTYGKPEAPVTFPRRWLNS